MLHETKKTLSNLVLRQGIFMHYSVAELNSEHILLVNQGENIILLPWHLL